jgi:hypothetical protein
MRRFRVRFNLGRGPNYMKWKVEGPHGVSYHSPTDTQLLLKGCELKNNLKAAKRIHAGESKSVCAWVLCEQIYFIGARPCRDKSIKISYNPKKNPHWCLPGGHPVDGLKVEWLHTIDYGIYFTGEKNPPMEWARI